MNRTEAQLPLSKRLLAVFFSLVLVVGLVPTSAWAEGAGEQGETQEQTDGQGNPGDEVSSDNGETTGETTDVVTDETEVEEQSDELPLSSPSNGGGLDSENLASFYPAVPAATTTLTYEGTLTNQKVFNALADLRGDNSTYRVKTNSGNVEIDKNSSGNFTPDRSGKSTYSVDYKVLWTWFTAGTLELVERPKVTNVPVGYTYDGSPKVWTPALENAKTEKLVQDTDYKVTYMRNGVETNDLITPGTITVHFTMLSELGYAAPDDVNYTIDKATNLDLACENYNDTYDGKPHGGTVTAIPADGTTIEYSTDNEKWSTEAPTRTDAGYTPVYVRATNPNYSNTAKGQYYIKVNKADGLEVTCSNQTYTYNGQPQGVGATANIDGSTIMYSTDSGENWSTTVPTVTDASDYTVNVSVKASNPNYNDVTGNYTITMNKAGVDVTVEGRHDTVTYDGQPHTVQGFDVTNVEGEQADLYNKDNVKLDDTKGAKAEVTGTDAKGYVMGLGTDSFKNTDTNFDVKLIVKDGWLNITKASDLTLSCESKEYTYNGEAQGEVAVPSDTNGTTVEYSTDGKNTWTTTAPTVKDVADGKVEVTARAISGNYENIPEVTYTIKVNQAKVIAYVKGDYKEFTYDGKEHKASGFEVTKVDGEGKGLYDKSNVVLAAGVEAEVSGIDSAPYTMGLTDKSFDNTDPNFDVDFDVDDGCLIIEQATGLSLDVSKAGYMGAYDGQEHGGAAVPSDTRNVTVTYSTDEGKTWSTDVPTVKDASEVTVQVRAESENFTLPAEATYTLKVTPAEIIVNVKGNTSTVTYNGEKQQVTGFTATTDSDLYDTGDVVLNEGFSDIASGTDAGNYTMGLGDDSFFNTNDNFNVTWNFQGDGGITIEKRAIQVSDSASVEYNGQEQVLDIDASKVTNLVDGDRLYLFGAQVKGTEPGTYADVTDYTWDVVNDELNVTKNYELTVAGELTITKAGSGSNGSSADNGANASDNASSDGSTTTKTADTALPFGVAAAAAAAALAAFAATRRLRSMKR